MSVLTVIFKNITKYSQTLPYYICTEWGNRCVNDCGNNNECQRACREDNPCGAQDPYKGNASISAAMSSAATASKTGSESAQTSIPVDGFGGEQPEDKDNAATLVGLGQSYGLAAVIGGLVAGFAFML
jgi:hypothetical protein